MGKHEFTIYAVRRELLVATVEADTFEEAKQLADENYYSYSWLEVDDSLNITITENI